MAVTFLTNEDREELERMIAENSSSFEQSPDQGVLTTAQINALDGMFKVCAFVQVDVSSQYNAFRAAFNLDSSGGGETPEEPDEPNVEESGDILASANWTIGNLGRLSDGTLKDYGGTNKEFTEFIPLNGATKVVANATGPLRQLNYFFAAETADSVIGATVLDTIVNFYISATNTSYPSTVETEVPSGANYITVTKNVNVTDVTVVLV